MIIIMKLSIWMIPQHLKTITLRRMVVAVVLMASAVWVGGKGLHADWWVNPLLQYALAQIHNWYRLIFGNIRNCHKYQNNLKNLKRKLHLFRVMDTKPSSTDCSVGARSWAREASTAILRLVQSRTNYNSVKLCKKTLRFRQTLFMVYIHIEHRLSAGSIKKCQTNPSPKKSKSLSKGWIWQFAIMLSDVNWLKARITLVRANDSILSFSTITSLMKVAGCKKVHCWWCHRCTDWHTTNQSTARVINRPPSWCIYCDQ